MGNPVQCVKLGKEAEGLDFPPAPGELGKQLLENVSKEAWQQWLAHQTMLINEKQLSAINPEHKAYLTDQLRKYFFDGEVDQPEGYTPPS